MLTLTGVSHRDAPLDVREGLSVAQDDVPRLLSSLAERFGAGTILSTCNRLEIYLAGDHERASVIEFLVEEGGARRELAEGYMWQLRDAAAVNHLYSVAAGIESMVVGESEILGQVREAFSAAVAAGSDDALLSRLFHSAIRTGRRARAETRIGHHALSVSSIAAQQARAVHEDIDHATVLVIGAGEAARLAATALEDRGVGEVIVANRTRDRAQTLAESLGGRALPFGRLDEALAQSDIVIAASGSAEHLVSCDQVREVMSQRDVRPLLVIDIGLPRDFEPGVRDVPEVTYYDLDDLQAIAAEHMSAREAEVGHVSAIVAEETGRFTDWWDQLQIVPTIAALTERAEALRQAEVAKSSRRLSLSAEQNQQLETLTKALVKQILHNPIATLRERGDREIYVDTVRRLFRLDEAPHATADPPSGADAPQPAHDA